MGRINHLCTWLGRGVEPAVRPYRLTCVAETSVPPKMGCPHGTTGSGNPFGMLRSGEVPVVEQTVDVDRTVTAALDVTLESPARLAVQIAAAQETRCSLEESIEITRDGAPMPWNELSGPHGGRLWLIDAGRGSLRVSYYATLSGSAAADPVDIHEELVYLRPSRYCESDRLSGFASRLFHGISEPADILNAVSSWVGTQLEYVSGSSGPTDGAVDTLLAGRGVCRDYAHLTVAILRALEIPARLVAVYAPGLMPMDFHAVAEAFIDGGWYVIDPTLLAPRSTLVRIATGRDSADTAFLSSYGGAIALDSVTVSATVSGDLPPEDVRALVQLV
jgi:transglutaminase-like putative cysteine protease